MHNFLKKIGDDRIKKGLIYAIWDGILWACMFGLAENYIVPFALVLGATTLQVSLIQGTAQLGVGMAQLLGARFILKFRKRKQLAILCSRLHAFSWLFMFFASFWTKSPWSVLIFYFLGLSAANFGGPGWVSWMNDLVPKNLRGEYWGLRNRIIGIAQFVFISLAGIVLHVAEGADKEIFAYGVLFTLAFAARFANFIPLGRQYEPPMSVPAFTSEFKFTIFLTKLLTTNFGRFALFIILMTFSINLIGPIIPVYIIKSLGFNYIQFTIVTMTAIVASFVFMTYWGRLSDMYGNYRILFITAIALPVLPVGWLLLRNFYGLIVLQVFSGFVFAGFNLATTNFIFDAVRRENISKIMAYFNTLNTFCAFLGALTGGLLVNLISHYDLSVSLLNKFTDVFAVSSLLRIAVILFFIRRFKEVREVEVSPALHFFYIYRPATNIINRFQVISDRFFKAGNSRNHKYSVPAQPQSTQR
jgi:MFS family permease